MRFAPLLNVANPLTFKVPPTVVSPVVVKVPVILVFLRAVAPFATVKPFPIDAEPVVVTLLSVVLPTTFNVLLSVVAPVTPRVPPTVVFPVVIKVPVMLVSLRAVGPFATVKPFSIVAESVIVNILALTEPSVFKPAVLNVVFAPTLTVFVVSSNSTLPTVTFFRLTSSVVATTKSVPLGVTVILFPAKTSA